MKLLPKLIALFALGFLATAAHFAFAAETKSAESKNCGCKCCVGKEVCCCHTEAAAATTETTAPQPVPEAAQPAGHPLKGVIVDLMPDQKALLVKHEEIPGAMKAMTMLLRVDDAALASAQKGAPVTGLLVRRGAVWWLDDVKIVPGTKK